ncbi:MAG: hypothetical protein J0H35_03800, partial [Rhodospirillales bacterium]|nr:hypothetical protein [Rhodospirillales bacterium]
MHAAEPRRSPTRVLQGLLLAAVVLPLLILAGGGWLAWRTVEADAVRDLQRSLAVTAEQATKILDSQILVADRVQDLLDDDAPAVLADEAGLRDRIAAMIARFPQITGVLVLDAAGHPVVSTARFPVDRQLDFAGRGFFTKLRTLERPVVIGPDLGGSLFGEPALIVARRRGMQRFDGVIVVAISPRTIESFDQTLLDGSNAFLAALFCSDGTPLARYPKEVRDDRIADGHKRLLERIAQQPLAGLLRIQSAFDDVERLVAYRRLDTYPVYVAIGRRWSSVWTAWFGVMATHLVIGVPATAALILLILLAMRRTRAQESALAALQTEVRRREIAEEALRQAQKMEAIGR